MKRFCQIASLCLCLLVIALFSSACGNPFKNAKVGDCIKMGNYSQGETGDIESIEWLVLSREENRILIISRYALEAKRFDNGSENRLETNDWNNSEIRQWLNNDFYNTAFNEKEKKYINPLGSDNVFLLSTEDAKKYFANNEARQCKPTDYAVKNGAFFVADNGYCSWWLRPPNHSNRVYYVNSCGNISDYSVNYAYRFARPALWINL